MLVRITMDRYGNVFLTPKSLANRAALRRSTGDDSVFLQSQQEIEDAFDDLRLSKSERRDIDEGWDVVKQVDELTWAEQYVRDTSWL